MLGETPAGEYRVCRLNIKAHNIATFVIPRPPTTGCGTVFGVFDVVVAAIVDFTAGGIPFVGSV